MSTHDPRTFEKQLRASKWLFAAFGVYALANLVLASLAQRSSPDPVLPLVVFAGLWPCLVAFITLFAHFAAGACFRPLAVGTIVALSLGAAVLNYILISAAYGV